MAKVRAAEVDQQIQQVKGPKKGKKKSAPAAGATAFQNQLHQFLGKKGTKTMKQQGIARSDAVKRNIESLGGELLDAYYCLGEYDVVAILEFPNNRAAMKASVLNSAMGHIKITTMPAVSRSEWKDLLREVWAGKTKRKK